MNTTTPNLCLAEAHALALIDYLGAKPEHSYGLCNYLSDALHFNYGWKLGIMAESYAMVTKARHNVPKIAHLFLGRDYVDYNWGPCLNRIRLAKLLLAELQTGRLTFLPHPQGGDRVGLWLYAA